MDEQAEAIFNPREAGCEKPSGAPSAARPAGGRFEMSPLRIGLLIGIVIAVQMPFLLYWIRGAPASLASVPLQDDFERTEIGDRYFSTGGHWRIENGTLHSSGVKNNPLWLAAKLPEDVAIEFDARSESNDGDIKCELFGNGRDHSSGYVVILGGWSNSVSVLARLDEHGRDRIENRLAKVEKGRTYRIRIERRGGLLRCFSDGALVMEFDDPRPLRGKGHDRFGFSSWDSDVFFDNLKIEPF
jgi:hypothetical protein